MQKFAYCCKIKRIMLYFIKNFMLGSTILAQHLKNLTTKKKVIICISIILLSILLALACVYVVLRLTAKELHNNSSYLSSQTLSTLLKDYDIVDIIEPEAQMLPIQIDDDTITITVTEVIEMVEEVEQTKENTIVVKPSVIDTSGLSKHQVKLGVDYISQYPELPTGCEITSLTTVLNYYGYDVSKTTMSDDYLEKSIDQVADFWKVFLGNPRSNGFGCYAEPIVNAANKYLQEQDNNHKAVNLSGIKFEKLLKEVENGNPVIIWSTMYGEKENDLREPYTTYKWEIDGKTIQWIAPEHCMVLIGYDIDRNIAIMSDPQRGIVEYNLETVKSRYIAMQSQCVILQEVDNPPVIEGVTDGEIYYTTQYITVNDKNLKSVTINGEEAKSKFFINGNINKKYKIIATDTSGNKTKVTIKMQKISSLSQPIDNTSSLNVNSDHKESINEIRNLLLTINTQYATQKEIDDINSIVLKCDTLLDKIESTTNEYNRIVTAVNDYNFETPTEEDVEIINNLVVNIDTLISTENLTYAQHDTLLILKSKCDELLSLITQPEHPDQSIPDVPEISDTPEEPILPDNPEQSEPTNPNPPEQTEVPETNSP